MNQVKLINLFISCPGDIKDEIDSIRLIISDINKTEGKHLSYVIQSLNWVEDTYTQVGEDPQDVINQQIDSRYDILVGIIWRKIGTKTNRAESGTIEEINRAINNSTKEVLIYFKTTPPESIYDIDTVQLQKVVAFKEELSSKGVLYKEFNSIDDFEKLFRINISSLIADKILPGQKNVVIASSNEDDKYSLINSIIDEVEAKSADDFDVFALLEEIESSANTITKCLVSMTDNISDIGKKVELKTKELHVANNIKDDRLRLQKSQVIVSVLAKELDDFNMKMNLEKNILDEHFTSIPSRYVQLIQLEKLDEDQNKTFRESFISYRESVQETTIQSAAFLKAISDWPPGTAKFNKSKRETELILKDVTKIFLNGLKLMDEAINDSFV